MKNYQITEWCRHFIREQVKPGDLCIDATMGNGHDTELLCRLVGDAGRVLAFDVLPEALTATKNRLEKAGVPNNYELHLVSHEWIRDFAAPETVSCITFNFGYLPGGDHTKATTAKSSIAAIRSGLALLKKGGIMSLCIYSGGDTGFEEHDAILHLLRSLDSRRYLVICSEYLNRPNHPPKPALIIRL